MSESEHSEDTCPVCGQEYVHKRESSGDHETTVLRADYKECIVTRHGPKRDRPNVAYVHETQRTVVSRLERSAERSGSDSPSLLDAIRGVGK